MGLNWKAGNEVLKRTVLEFKKSFKTAVVDFLKLALWLVVTLTFVMLLFAMLVYRAEKKEVEAFEARATNAGFEDKILEYHKYYLVLEDFCQACTRKNQLTDSIFPHRIDKIEVQEIYKKGLKIELRQALPQYFSAVRPDTKILAADCHEGRIRAANQQLGHYEDYFYIQYTFKDEKTNIGVTSYSGFHRGACVDSLHGWTRDLNTRYFVKNN